MTGQPVSIREVLPTRRESNRFNFIHDGFEYTATWSRHEDGRLAEVFLSVARSGAAVEGVARDAAILASLCLQHGVTAEAIRHSLTRLEYGEPAGPVGRFLDVLAMQESEDAA